MIDIDALIAEADALVAKRGDHESGIVRRMSAALTAEREKVAALKEAFDTMYEQFEAEKAAADTYGNALREIHGADPVNLALDPEWPQRIAREALDRQAKAELAAWKLNAEQSKQLVDALINPPEPNEALCKAAENYKRKVAALEAEVKIAEAKGWRDAVTCVQYCKTNWSQDCRSEAERNALADAAGELINELVAASPGDWLGAEWKTAQDYSDTIASLENKLDRIRLIEGDTSSSHFEKLGAIFRRMGGLRS